MLVGMLRALRRRDGSVTVISALVLPVLIAIVGFVAEYGNGLLHKAEDQRIADAAAFAAATAYNENSSDSMSQVVNSIAAMNGITSSNISASVVNSPSGDGNQAVEVTVTTQTPLMLTEVLNIHQTSLTETATAYAEMKGGTPGCIIALASGGAGVTLSGGTSVTAASCAVSSDSSVTVPCGTTITTTTVDYDSASAPSEPCTGIVAPTGKTLAIHKASTSDPLAGTSELATATSRLTTGTFYTTPGGSTTASTAGVEGLTSPAQPAAVTGPAVTPGYTATDVPPVTGCTDPSYSAYSATHNWVCTGNGPFNFGAVTIGGGITFTVTVTGNTTTPVFNIASINMSGTAMTWPAGNYNIPGGISVSGGNTDTFGQGTYVIGTGVCSNGYSICNSTTMISFGGATSVSPGSIVMTTSGGISNGGGSTMVLGTGSANSFDIGKASNGDSFTQAGGGVDVFGDATGSGDVFEMAGNLDVPGGGSCLYVSAAAEHDINGYFASAGGTVMGPGVYTVADYVALGSGGGGDVSCTSSSFPSVGQPSTFGLYADNVSLVIGGAALPSNGDAFYMGAGYSNVTLLAPTTGALANLAVVGPQSGTAPAVLAEGASGADFSGAFYFPTAPISLSGGSSLGSFGSSQCLMLIGSQVTLSGGAALASSCSGIGGSSGSSTVALVQ
ncbi:MAG TPA: pilus assembly protein TadG-related protein [Caulobacteraceae bacterium]|nr:pilus assembly protein TadG-related protein [Caulobacteraceae bacterium]